MTDREIRDRIKGIALEQTGAELSDKGALKSSGLDSLSLVVLIAGIENAFGITFKDDDLAPENINTLADLTALTGRYL